MARELTRVHPEWNDSREGQDESNMCAFPSNEEAKELAVYFTDRARIKCSFGFEDMMVLVTLFVLFGDDIRVLCFTKTADLTFEVFMSVSLFVFVLEFLINSWSKTTIHFDKPSALSSSIRYVTRNKIPEFTCQGYLFGFYFWLDFLAVVSMFPDIPWIANPLGIGLLSVSGVSSDVGATVKLGKVARMVRLVRLVKLYKAGAMRIEAKRRDLELLDLMMKGLISPQEFQDRQLQNWMEPAETQSKLGAELSDTTTKRVIAIVLMMLCFVPVLGVPVTNYGPQQMTSSLQAFNEQHDALNLLSSIAELRSYFEVATPRILPKSKDQPYLVYLEVFPSYPEFEIYGCHNATPTWQNPSKSIGAHGGNLGQASVCLRKDEWVGGGGFKTPRAVRNANDIDRAQRARLRSSEVLGDESHRGVHGGVHYSKDCCITTASAQTGACASRGPCYIRYKFNMKVELMDAAILNIMTTIFITVMLVVGAHTFILDADCLVLRPIREMMESVRKVSDDPSYCIDTASLKQGGGEYETLEIANAIKKITDLLRIGFGVAGSEIVRENLSTSEENMSAYMKMQMMHIKSMDTEESHESCIDLMGNPGKRVYSVFGFCMIENFDHLTEKMGEEIMDFVNEVASIVHENVSAWGGQCNKNLGGSFLMTWKVPDMYTKTKTEQSTVTSDLDVSRIPYIARIADRALIGFLKIIADLNRDKRILAYQKRKDLFIKDESTGEMVPFKVRMGFGLHIGWAIEGPVGSRQKVDATYLSPHVNMAARCETAAKQWDVPLLCTDVFYSCLSKPAQLKMRQVDKVLVKGSETAVSMYTYDAFEEQEMISRHDVSAWGRLGFEKYTKRASDEYDADSNSIFDLDPDLIRLRRHIEDTATSKSTINPHGPGSPVNAWLQRRMKDKKLFITDEPWMSKVQIHMIHSKGLTKYLNGEWQEARVILKLVDHLVTKRKTLFAGSAQLNPLKDPQLGDGPSQAVLAFMEEWGFTPPANWDPSVGRSLTKK